MLPRSLSLGFKHFPSDMTEPGQGSLKSVVAVWESRLLLATGTAPAPLPGPFWGQVPWGRQWVEATAVMPNPFRRSLAPAGVRWMPQRAPGHRSSLTALLKASPMAPSRAQRAGCGECARPLERTPCPLIHSSQMQFPKASALPPGLVHRAQPLCTSSLFEGSVLLGQGTRRLQGSKGWLQVPSSPAGSPLLSLSSAGRPGPKSPQRIVEFT